MNNQSLKIYVFYCSSDPDIVEPIRSYSENKSEMKTVPLPCSGKIDIPYLTKAFETGAGGVAVVICQQGECRFLEGELRAKKRAEAVDRLLDETGLGKGRIAVIQMKDGGAEQIMGELEDFRVRIKALSSKIPGAGILD